MKVSTLFITLVGVVCLSSSATPPSWDAELQTLKEHDLWLHLLLQTGLNLQPPLNDVAMRQAVRDVVRCRSDEDKHSSFNCLGHVSQLLQFLKLDDAALTVMHTAVEYLFDDINSGVQFTPEEQRQIMIKLNYMIILVRNSNGHAEAEELFEAVSAIDFVNWDTSDQIPPVYIPGARSFPWWPTEGHDWLPVEEIEAAYPQIRAEFDHFLETKGSFRLDGDHDLIAKGSWKEFILFENGMMNASSCEWMPTACKIFSSLKQTTGYHPNNSPMKAQVTIFQLAPGTHLRPHTGPCNDRLTMHLGLIIPKGVSIRVSNDTRTWTEGKVILFDDSYEHEVHHRGNSTRYVIYATIHHPDIYPPDWLKQGPYLDGKNLADARRMNRNMRPVFESTNGSVLTTLGAADEVASDKWMLTGTHNGANTYTLPVTSTYELEMFLHTPSDAVPWWNIQEIELINGTRYYGDVLYGAPASEDPSLVPATGWQGAEHSDQFAAPEPAPQVLLQTSKAMREDASMMSYDCLADDTELNPCVQFFAGGLNYWLSPPTNI